MSSTDALTGRRMLRPFLGALLALALPASALRLVFAVFVGLVGLRLARDGIRPEETSP